MISLKNLILEGYGLLCCAALPALLLSIRRPERRLARAGRIRRGVLFCLFVFYLAGVLSVTGAGTLWDLLYRGWSFPAGQLNLALFASPPFSSGFLLNILLFVPLGFLIPMLWPGRWRVPLAAVCGAGFSLAIECSQLLNSRITDLDDLVANALGALAGALAAALLRLVFCQKRTSSTQSALGVPLFLAAAFLGRFLLFDELRAAGWLYGF